MGIEARSLVSTFVRAQARSDGSLDSSKDRGTLFVQILKHIADLEDREGLGHQQGL